MQKYERGEFWLQQLYGVQIEERDVNGSMEKVVVIPMTINGIVLLKRNKLILNTTLLPYRGCRKDTAKTIVLSLNENAIKMRHNMGITECVAVGRIKGVNKTKKEGNLNKLDNILSK